MQNYFDYVFYAACKFYRENERGDSSFRTAGLLVISTAQCFNLMSLFFILCLILHPENTDE